MERVNFRNSPVFSCSRSLKAVLPAGYREVDLVSGYIKFTFTTTNEFDDLLSASHDTPSSEDTPYKGRKRDISFRVAFIAQLIEYLIWKKVVGLPRRLS